jgi:hypothetical protein
MTIEQYPSSNNIASTTIWKYTATGSELTLSGYDNYSQALQFSAGSEQVFLNGVLLVRNLDYTPAANGLSITFPSNLAYNDFVQIYCYSNYSIASVASSSITGTIQNSQLTNPSITIGNQSINLGGTLTTPTGLSISGSTNTLTNIPNSALSNSNIIINGVPTPLGGTINITTPNTILSQKGGLIVGTGGGSVQQLTVGADGTTPIADSSQASGISWSGPSVVSGKNILVNGGFDIWARGTTATFSSTYQYLADKWISYTDTGTVVASQIAVSSSDGLPTGVKYAMRMNRTVGSNADRTIAIYVIEGATAYIGKTLTLSYYIRYGSGSTSSLFSNISTRTYRFGPQYDGVNQTLSANSFNSTTFTKVTQQIAITSNTLTNAGDLFEIEIGFNQLAGTNTYFDIAAVQLEVGSAATPFARNAPTVALENISCMKYYQPLFLPNLDFNQPVVRESTTNFVINQILPVPMRTTPTLSYYTSGSPNASPIYGRGVFRDTSFSLSVATVTNMGFYGSTNQYEAVISCTHSSTPGSYVYSEFDTFGGNVQIGLMADY